jgi:hypothetical protein
MLSYDWLMVYSYVILIVNWMDLEQDIIIHIYFML